MRLRHLNRRRLLQSVSLGGLGAAVLAACGETITITKEVPVEVIKEVQVAGATVVKEVKVEVAGKTVIKEVEVPVEVVKEVVKEVVVEKIVEVESKLEAQAVTYWHAWNQSRLPLIEKQIAAFEEQHPHIKVRHTLITQQGMDEKYTTAIAGGDPPDVIMIHGQRHVLAFAENEVLTPLDDFMAKDGINPDIWFDFEMSTYAWKGKQWALPYATGTNFHLFFWNKDLYKEAGVDPEYFPKTWSEFDELSAKLTKKDGDEYVRIAGDPLRGASPTNPWSREWTFLNAGEISSDDRKTVLYNSPEGKGALRWAVEYYNKHYGSYENVKGIVSGARTQFRTAYKNQVAATCCDGIWMFGWHGGNMPGVEWGAAHVPYNGDNPAAKNRYLVEGGWGYGIPKGVRNEEAAWEFLKWTTAGEGNLEFFVPQTRPSPVREYNKDPRFAEKYPEAWKLALEVMDASEYSPAAPVQTKLNDITFQMEEEALLQKKSPEEAVEWAAGEAQKELDKWWEQQ
jgi:multiple sugar transport system substrate-binding protein